VLLGLFSIWNLDQISKDSTVRLPDSNFVSILEVSIIWTFGFGCSLYWTTVPSDQYVWTYQDWQTCWSSWAWTSCTFPTVPAFQDHSWTHPVK
jgi:hypothetical protein